MFTLATVLLDCYTNFDHILLIHLKGTIVAQRNQIEQFETLESKYSKVCIYYEYLNLNM